MLDLILRHEMRAGGVKRVAVGINQNMPTR